MRLYYQKLLPILFQALPLYEGLDPKRVLHYILILMHFLHGGALWGQGFAVFVITLAAAEAVVGLALVLAIYRNLKTTYVERMNILKG